MKRIILISDFTGPEAPNSAGIEEILNQLRGNGYSLDVIKMDDGKEMGEQLRFMAEKLISPLDGTVFGIDEALEMLSKFAIKRPRQVVTFKGTLDLGVALSEGT